MLSMPDVVTQETPLPFTPAEAARHLPPGMAATLGRTWTLAQARAYCRRLAQSHYENFLVGSLFLPRTLLPHFHHVYAFCRWADDLADETAGGAVALGLLGWWRDELNRLYAGTPRHPVMVALRDTVQQFAIPMSLFTDLLAAFEQDQRVKRYATFADLLGYCRGSANPVGRMVLHLFEAYNEKDAELADALCTGLQLANFWQDVRRDWGKGRVYLPWEDRERFGHTDADFAQPHGTAAYCALIRFQVERTEEFFRRGEALGARVPRRFRPEIELFLGGGRAVLSAIAASGYDTWRVRPRVGKWTQARLLFGSLVRSVVLGGR